MSSGDIDELPAAIGYRFVDPDLLRLALAHRSWCAENGQVESNERLEFLGDAVLGLTIASEVFDRYPDLSEGELAKLRAGVVNAQTLARVARQVGLGDYLLLGKGEAATGGSDKQSILADALEAVIGAVYLDGGPAQAAELILRLWSDEIAQSAREGPGGFDHKTRLQELAVQVYDRPPDYKIQTSGPDHARVFSAKVVVGEQVVGEGTGTSKKEAEQAAAGEAFQALKRESARSADSDSEIRAS